MAVIGSGPFEFTDANGRQVSIPLTALSFASGVLQVDPTTWHGVTDGIADFVNALATQGILKPASLPQSRPAMVITATDPLGEGNLIKVDIAVNPAANRDPTQTEISLTVTETDSYPGLTLATIEAKVGNDTAPGSQPGLAHILHASLAPALLPVNQKLPFPVAAAGASAKVDIVDATPATVFTLEAKKPGPDSQFTTAEILNAGAKTFDLKLTWTHPVVKTKLPTLSADLAALGYEIIVKPPADSGVFSVPAATGGPISLTGGAASAIIFTSE
jgi:hypothetical protein